MLNLVAIALGAALGANLRYGLTTWAVRRLGAAWPYGTFLVNVLGCLVIGILLTLTATRLSLSEPLRLFLVTGLLGGFTTFSTFGYESFTLITRGDWLGAGLYIGGSVIVGLAAVFLGASLARVFGP
jgi:CrcB protein